MPYPYDPWDEDPSRLPYDPVAARNAPAGGHVVGRSGKPTLGSLEGPGVGMEEYSYENMSDEELEQLVALGVLDQQEAEKMRLKQRAELVRDRAGPEGIRAGKSFVAASPLSFLAKGLEDYAAGKEIKQLDKELADIQRQQTQGRGTYWDLLRGKRRKPQDISSATSLPMPRLDEEEY